MVLKIIPYFAATCIYLYYFLDTMYSSVLDKPEEIRSRGNQTYHHNIDSGHTL